MTDWRRPSRHVGASWFFVVAVALAQPPTGAAQPVLTSDSASRCSSCRIELGPPIRLTGEFEDGALLNTAAVIRYSQSGQIYVRYTSNGSEIYLHRADGGFAGRRVGRRGSGPGEFQHIKHLHTTDTSLIAFDWLQTRLTEIDTRTYAVLRTLIIPDHHRLGLLDDGSLVLSGSIARRESAGFPLHVYAPDGRWQRSLGASEPVLRPGSEVALVRALHPAGVLVQRERDNPACGSCDRRAPRRVR
jgi:hypothetical protein